MKAKLKILLMKLGYPVIIHESNGDKTLFAEIGYWTGTGTAVHSKYGLMDEILKQAFPAYEVENLRLFMYAFTLKPEVIKIRPKKVNNFSLIRELVR